MRWGEEWRPAQTFAEAVITLALVWGWGLLLIALAVRIGG